jgi:uncharacterized protein (DUF1684 family)
MLKHSKGRTGPKKKPVKARSAQTNTATDDPLLRLRDFDISDANEIIRTVQITKDGVTYRIEVIRNHNGTFNTRCFKFEPSSNDSPQTESTLPSGRFLPVDAAGDDERDQNVALEWAFSNL